MEPFVGKPDGSVLRTPAILRKHSHFELPLFMLMFLNPANV